MKTLEIQPLSAPVDATVSVPGSKSITNRALLIAALAEGRSTLSGALFSDDTRYMAEALRKLGVAVEADEAAASFTVDGAAGRFPASEGELFIGNSGTTARFLTAALGLGKGRYTVDGTARMRQRPIKFLLDGLAPLGVKAVSREGNGCPPVDIEASGITGGTTRANGSYSSQYFTALLLPSPYAQSDVTVEVEGDLVSKPYLDITMSVMRTFGASVDHDNYGRFRVEAGTGYEGRDYDVEPDASAASYFMAAAAVTGGRVLIKGVRRESAQGDVRFADVLEQMGCRVQWADEGVTVEGPEQLAGIDVDMNAISDTVMTLAAIAPFAAGPVTIRNVAHIRVKETERIEALETELRKMGVTVDGFPDGLTIQPCDDIRPAEIDTYDDHRMAMSFAVAGLKAPGIVIRDPDCVAKTFPSFFDVLEGLRREPSLS